jgi:hypothetical protein
MYEVMLYVGPSSPELCGGGYIPKYSSSQPSSLRSKVLLNASFGQVRHRRGIINGYSRKIKVREVRYSDGIKDGVLFLDEESAIFFFGPRSRSCASLWKGLLIM